MRALDLSNIPPSIPLLIAEIYVKCEDQTTARKRLKALLPELKQQSLAYWDTSLWDYADRPSPTSFHVYADSSLDLFNVRTTCRAFSCRVSAAQRLARSLGLFADTIWLTDYFTPRFCDFGRITNQKLDDVLDDILILAELLPLIAEGIIKFRPSARPVCQSCHHRFDSEVDALTRQLVSEYMPEFRMELTSNGGYSLFTGELFHPELVLTSTPRKSSAGVPTLEEAAYKIISQALRSALWAAADAHFGGGAVLSNSQIAMSGMARKEGLLHAHLDVRTLDAARSIVLPWVSDLSTDQIPQLRQEASKALPALREMLAQHMTNATNGDATQTPSALVDELRMQCVDVRNELENARKHSATFWKSSYAVLGLGISAYGLGSGQILPAVGGLLPIIQLIAAHKSGSEKDIDKIQRRPGFVLVKAQEILNHEH